MSLFAVLGFLYVPLGHHTGFEHAKAVLSTPAASAAIEDLTTAAVALRERALQLVTGQASAESPAKVESAKAPTKARGTEPRAVPPKLK